jgi:hypothetical protein
MKKIFPVCACAAFTGSCGLIVFLSFKDAPFVKFVGQTFAAIFHFAFSAFAHG